MSTYDNNEDIHFDEDGVMYKVEDVSRMNSIESKMDLLEKKIDLEKVNSLIEFQKNIEMIMPKIESLERKTSTQSELNQFQKNIEMNMTAHILKIENEIKADFEKKIMTLRNILSSDNKIKSQMNATLSSDEMNNIKKELGISNHDVEIMKEDLNKFKSMQLPSLVDVETMKKDLNKFKLDAETMKKDLIKFKSIQLPSTNDIETMKEDLNKFKSMQLSSFADDIDDVKNELNKIRYNHEDIKKELLDLKSKLNNSHTNNMCEARPADIQSLTSKILSIEKYISNIKGKRIL